MSTDVNTGSSLVAINATKRNRAEPWIRALRARSLAVDAAFPDSPGAMKSLLREKGREATRLVIGGGDGTLRSVARELADIGKPVGVLPMGTANDLAVTLGIPVNPEGAADVIAGGHLRAVDLGCVNGHCYFNAAQLGLGAAVGEHLSPRLKQVLGGLSYAVGAWDCLRSMRPFHATVTMNGDTRHFRSIHIVVGNGVQYGGGHPVSPNAAIDDAALDLMTVEPVPRWRLALIAAAVRAGRQLDVEPVTLLRGPSIQLETSRPMRITADGEEVTRTPADFTVLPKAISIYTGS